MGRWSRGRDSDRTTLAGPTGRWGRRSPGAPGGDWLPIRRRWQGNGIRIRRTAKDPCPRVGPRRSQGSRSPDHRRNGDSRIVLVRRAAPPWASSMFLASPGSRVSSGKSPTLRWRSGPQPIEPILRFSLEMDVYEEDELGVAIEMRNTLRERLPDLLFNLYRMGPEESVSYTFCMQARPWTWWKPKTSEGRSWGNLPPRGPGVVADSYDPPSFLPRELRRPSRTPRSSWFRLRPMALWGTSSTSPIRMAVRRTRFCRELSMGWRRRGGGS